MTRPNRCRWGIRLLLAILVVAGWAASPAANEERCANCGNCGGNHCCVVDSVETWEFCHAGEGYCVEAGKKCDDNE